MNNDFARKLLSLGFVIVLNNLVLPPVHSAAGETMESTDTPALSDFQTDASSLAGEKRKFQYFGLTGVREEKKRRTESSRGDMSGREEGGVSESRTDE